jgi:hypothetical protein
VVVLPGKMLDNHGVSPFIAETSRSLHEVQVLIIAIVTKEVVLML